MSIIGYSDRINHALAFAAKHHDQQVRKGTRAPYLTQPANMAVILTRYGQDEGVVIAGILHDVMDDTLRDGFLRQTLEQRIGARTTWRESGWRVTRRAGCAPPRSFIMAPRY
jgi:(p)ppGpp synthase/HD superfamily hydrolase